jgi:hypothetical protein
LTSPNEDLLEPIHERGLLIQHGVDAGQGALQRYGMLFSRNGSGLTGNFLRSGAAQLGRF